MHFSFTFNQILWILTFAGQLTLLTVLLGQERIRRFPFFTASIALFTLRLLVETILSSRMAAIPFRITIVLLAFAVPFVGILAAVEVARRAFAAAPGRVWRIAAPGAIVVAAAVAAFWGQWPVFRGFSWRNLFAVLSLLQFVAQKADHFYDLLILEAVLLILLFGKRYGSGWLSHACSVATGLGAVALSWVAIQAGWLIRLSYARPRTQQEYESLVSLGNALMNMQKCVYLAAVIWWVYSLWRNESAAPDKSLAAPAPVEAAVDTLIEAPPEETVG